jgi:hypothetical protein
MLACGPTALLFLEEFILPRIILLPEMLGFSPTFQGPERGSSLLTRAGHQILQTDRINLAAGAIFGQIGQILHKTSEKQSFSEAFPATPHTSVRTTTQLSDPKGPRVRSTKWTER